MIANAGAEKCQTKRYHKTIENIALNKKLKKFNVVILIGQNDVYLDYYEQHYVYFDELFFSNEDFFSHSVKNIFWSFIFRRLKYVKMRKSIF